MSSDSAEPDIPDRSWGNPFPEGHPMHELYGRRVRNGQDLAIVLDDYHARRGTGKTVAALQLAEGMDQTGGLRWSKCSLSAESIRNAYADEPPRSGLVLDEGEVGASNREAMTKSNQALREIMSMGRVEQKYIIINTPSIGFLDKDIRLLADVWITMLRKGLALVHFLKRQPYAKQGRGKLITEKKGLIDFDDIKHGTRLRDIYNKLTKEKRQRIAGEEGQGFIPREKHEEKLEEVRKEVRKETRNELLADTYYTLKEDERTSVRQGTLGDAVGLTQQQVGNIVRKGRDA